MIPILYAKNASDFSNNGIGILKDAISCEVSEERNGSYSLTLKYPISGNWFSSIGEGSIVKAKPNEISDPQLFRIRKSSKPIKGTVTFYADHISYDLSGLPVMGLTMASTTPGAAMTEAIEASPIQSGFTAWSDIGTLRGIDITEPRSVRALIGGQAGSVLSIWGGELEFDNFAVKLHSSRGSNNGVILNYGKNITDAKQERNIESCYTHFCPYAVKTVNTTSASGEIIDQQKITVKLSEEIIELVDPHDIGHSRALILDMSDQFGEGEEITEAALRIKAEEYIESHELGTPDVNITVKFVQIWDTPEYESFAALERVRLCDVVTVRFEELGISATAKVIKTVYDVLKERYSSIEIGSAKESLADSFESVEGQIKETSETVSENKSAQEAALNNAIIEATNKITGNAGGYVVLHPANYPSEILIMNTNDINTATKVWRWNSSGLGYSSNGYAGTYGLAMTIDGSIVADYITTGTLTAINISGCTISGGTLNIGSGKFKVDSNGNIHAEGFIKATSGEIGGCSIVNGVLQVPAARITGTLTASQIDATNLHVSAANVNGTLTASQIDVGGVISAGNISIKSITLSSVAVYYALSTSSTTAPSSGWSTTAPTWESGKYMWQKIVWTFANGSTSESAATCISGAKGDTGTSVRILGSYNTYEELIAAHPTGSQGDGYLVAGYLYVWNGSAWQNVGQIKGDKGDDGTGITSIETEYYLSTSKVTPTGGSWSTNSPVWAANKYIWTRSHIVWDDGAESYTNAEVANAINSANEQAAAARIAVEDIEGNIYYSGTTEIDGGKIRTGSVTALQINATDLHVSSANIDGTLTASQIDATDLHVSAANITGTLVIGQLPSTVAKISDIPTNNNQLTNGAGYQTSANVVSIIDGRITAAYIEALSISVGAAQITGKLTASQINADGITASNVTISGAVTATSGSVSELTVAGKLYFGNNRNYYLNANYNDSSYYIKLPGFQVDDASGAVFSGKLNAPSGNIGGCSIVNGVLQVPVANIIGSITATALEVKSGSYTYFKAGDGAVQIGGFNVDNNSLYSGSTFSNSAVFLCTGSTGYLTIGGHYGTSWGLKVGTKFGVNTSGELYCTSAHLSGSIEATSGTFHSGCVLGANLQIREWTSYFTALCTQGMTLPSSLGDAPTAATAGMILISSADTEAGVLTFRSASSRSNISANTFEIYDTGSNVYTKRLYFHSGDIKSYSQGILNYSLDSYYSRGDNYVLARGEWRIGGTRSSGYWYHSLKANIANSSAGGGGALLGTWTGTVSSGSGSDRNIKHNIEDMPEAYEKLFDDLRPVRFKYDDGTSDRYHTGFIAQEVKAATEAAGLSTQDFAAYYTFERQISETEYVTTAALRYGEFVSLNTWEIQKLKAKIKALEERISALEG